MVVSDDGRETRDGFRPSLRKDEDGRRGLGRQQTPPVVICALELIGLEGCRC